MELKLNYQKKMLVKKKKKKGMKEKIKNMD